MMRIEADFLQEEEREGFLVASMMKRAWATELLVLSEIDRICEKYDISYQANYGTLLGAVRHRGFVPWDDDIDLSMKREDFMKFVNLAPHELPEPMRLQSIETKKDHFGAVAAVVNRTAADVGIGKDEVYTKQFYDCPYVVGVDIYPLDYIPRDPDEAGLQRVLYESVYDAAYRFDELQETGALPAILKELERLTGEPLPEDEHLRQHLWMLSERIAMLYSEEESDYLIWMPDWIFQYEIDVRRPKTWYEKTERVPFEMTTIPIPCGYHEILTLIYGDYLEPVQGGGAHDYPFYAKQEEARQEYFRRRG